MKIAVLMAAIAVLVLSCPLSSTGAMETLLPPKAPWALAWPLSNHQRVLRAWEVNSSMTLSTTTHWVMLRINASAIEALLGLDLNGSLMISANGQSFMASTGRYNMSFAQVLDLVREYHGNITARWHVVVRHIVPQESHEAPPPGGEPAWVKYRWAFVAAIAAVVVGLKAGKDMKEARLKAKWKKLLASKAMDLDKALQGMESEGHEGEDMGRFLLAA